MSLDGLKRLRARLRKRRDNWRERYHNRRHQTKFQRRRKRRHVQARKRLIKEREALRKKYDALVPPPEAASEVEHRDFEQNAARIKAHLVGITKRIEEHHDEVKDALAAIDRGKRKAKHAAKQVRWYSQVRLPHVRRRIKRKKRELADRGWSPTGSGIVTFDGKPTAEWIAYRLEVARAAGWRGYETSGYRTPEHSEELCFGICGNPSCPGLCAGRSSNHTQHVYSGGATDNTYAPDARAIWAAKAGSIPGVVLTNHLPFDIVHSSATGY